MQAAVLRLARPTASLRRAVVLRPFATATANPAHVAGATSAPASVTPKTANIPLNNIEQHWSKLSEDEQSTLYDELQELQKKDWKQLTLDEKKASYYVAFGPHGPRTPISKPGDNWKIAFWVSCAIGVAGLISFAIKSNRTVPRTMNSEWQEASNARAIEQKMNPITGISSEGYTGKGFVQSTSNSSETK